MSADAQLRVKIGTPVIGADGKRIGDVDGVVLNPANNRVRQILMRKGTFLHSDQSFGVPSVTGIDEKGLHVSFTSEEAGMMDHRMSSDYMTPAAGAFVGTGVYMAEPALREQGVMTRDAEDREASDDHLGTDQRLFEFRRGATVIDKDGVELGKIGDLAAVTGGVITALRVDHGRRRRHTEQWISVHLVTRTDEEHVMLSVSAADIDQLATEQEAIDHEGGFVLDTVPK